MMLTAMKVSATGMPMNSSTVDPPSISQAARPQPLTRAPSCRAHRVVAWPPLGALQADHAKDHFNSQHHEYRRQRRQRPPFRGDQGLDVDRARGIAGPGGLGAVPGDDGAASQADKVADPLEV